MIIFLGDSITEFGNWETLLPEFNIANFGVAGNKTYEVIDRVDELFEKEAHQLFLLIGINDLGENRPISDIVIDYNKLVKLIINKKVASEIILISVLPIIESSWGKYGLTNKKIKELNSEIESRALENIIYYLDINYYFKDKTGQLDSKLTTDGLHLNEAGYSLFAKLIEKKINSKELTI